MKRGLVAVLLVFLVAFPVPAGEFFRSVDRWFVYISTVDRFKVHQEVLSAQSYVPSWETVDRWYVVEARVGEFPVDDKITVGAFVVAMEVLSAQSKVPPPDTVDRWYTDIKPVDRFKVDLSNPVDNLPYLDP